MLDVKRLRILREVAAQGSFSAAADALSYTQSAVSQQIAALEREAGTTLVERGARGVHLTQAGRALVVHADAILARLAAAERELESIAGLHGGHLRLLAFPSAAAILARLAAAERELESIAGLHGGHLRLVAFPSAAASLMPVAIAEFRRRHPAVELTLEPREPDDAIACLKSGECDVALAIEASFRPLEDPAVVKDPLVDDPMFLVMPRDHPLARKRN